MGHILLKLSDKLTQQRLETIMGQLDWSITGRTVSERRELPPLLTYRLEGTGNTQPLYDAIPRIGYGLVKEPLLKKIGPKSTLHLTLRQLVPTQTESMGGLKTFGDGAE